MNKDLSGLLLVDIQEKLTPLVLHAEKLVTQCSWLIRLAQEMKVPIMFAEQYPSGLGKTVEPLRTLTQGCESVEKVEFSCFRHPAFLQKWNTLGKKQVIVAGIETHVCVLQTAIDLKQSTDLDVFVVVDAVSSRSEMDHKYGLKRMKQAGVELVTSEMVFFEWIEHAGTSAFKALSQSFLR